MIQRTILAGVLLLALSAGAIGNGPLPEFSAVALNGAPVDGRNVAAEGKWLLIYVESNCAPCTDVLNLFRPNNKEVSPAGQIAVIVGGATPEQVTEYKKRFKGLADAHWYADPSSAVRGQLDLPASPTVIGLRDHVVTFSMVGALAKRDEQKAFFLNWLQEQ